MSFPDPHPGLVIRYAYLWKREHDEGREEGSKDRPCAIVLSVLDDDGEPEVMVLAITHSAPQRAEDGIEIPTATKHRLGLDSERSWIVITEANEFVWPGPDLRPVPGRDDSTIVHGALPPKFFAYVHDLFLQRIARDKAQAIKKDGLTEILSSPEYAGQFTGASQPQRRSRASCSHATDRGTSR